MQRRKLAENPGHGSGRNYREDVLDCEKLNQTRPAPDITAHIASPWHPPRAGRPAQLIKVTRGWAGTDEGSSELKLSQLLPRKTCYRRTNPRINTKPQESIGLPLLPLKKRAERRMNGKTRETQRVAYTGRKVLVV